MSEGKLKTTVEILPLRDSMENRPAFRLEQSLLVDGYLVGRYTGTGDSLVCDMTDKANPKLLQNSSPTICFVQYGFEVISIHQNDILQVVDVKTKKSDIFRQPKETMLGVRRVVANARFIVAIALKRLLVWERSSLGKPPRVVDTTCAPNPITAVSERSTMTQEDRVVIINNSPGGHIFQVWDVSAGRLCCFADNKGNSDTYTVAVNDNGIVAATCRDNLCVWLTYQHAPGDDFDATVPDQKNTYSGTFLSSLYVDNFMIITGDNYGGLNMHSAEGYFLYHVNQVAISGEMVDLTATTNRTELASLFRSKVNKIVRCGRWIIAGFENSRISIFDFFSPNATRPVDTFTHSVNGTIIRDLSVFSKSIHAIAVQPADSKESKALKTGKARVDLITWYPKLEQDDLAFFYGDQKLWHGSPIALLRKATDHVLVALEGADSVFPAQMYSLNKTSLKNATGYMDSIMEIQKAERIVVPFTVTQNAHNALQEYLATLVKINKANKVPKFADALEELRVKFMMSLNLCLNSIYFLLELKKKNGSATPYGGKEYTVYANDGDDEDKSFLTSCRFDDDDRNRAVTPSKPFQKEAGFDGMLSSVLEDIGCAHDTTLSMIESFDDACNKELKDQDDQERINSLLAIFTKLRQLDEDMKEVAKEIGKLAGQESSDSIVDADTSVTWWGFGGEYDDDAGY